MFHDSCCAFGHCCKSMFVSNFPQNWLHCNQNLRTTKNQPTTIWKETFPQKLNSFPTFERGSRHLTSTWVNLWNHLFHCHRAWCTWNYNIAIWREPSLTVLEVWVSSPFSVLVSSTNFLGSRHITIGSSLGITALFRRSSLLSCASNTFSSY